MADEQTQPDCAPVEPGSLLEQLSKRIVGQPSAIDRIVPYLQMYRAHLSPPDRPAGIFLLLGPTGTGKTRTVEALAEILHGSARQLLKIDCAEYQSDHEVAKLIGAPPGYVGHRETKPLLTQERLAAVTSQRCGLALVLFDEIEKAAPALTALLLGVFDRATMRLGDNTRVNFERTLIFLTSNLGAREMTKVVRPGIGFQGVERRSPESIADRMQAIGIEAVRRRFSPEFVNRIDAVITYRPLDQKALGAIVDHHIDELRQHVRNRLADRSFDIEVTPAARRFVLERGTSEEYGARELKRTIHRVLTQPLAALVAEGLVAPGGRVVVDLAERAEELAFGVTTGAFEGARPEREKPVVLAVDENEHLVNRIAHALEGAGMTPFTTRTGREALELATMHRPDVAIVDLILPDGDGLSAALVLLRVLPRLQVIVTAGSEMSPDEEALCERQGFPILRKPFLPEEAIKVVRDRLFRSSTAGR
ncbi:MAG: AAA family ATPase [Vicinamibacterales bacterium]